MRPRGLHLPRDERRTLVEIARNWPGLKKDFIAKYGVTRNTANSIFDEAGRPEPEPVEDQWSEYERIHVKPRIRVSAVTQNTPPEGPVHRVIVIGDAHDKPNRDKDRFLWIGRLIAERQPHAVVSIGDWVSLDSLSRHEVPGSQADAERPAFHLELESADESLSVFHREFPVGSIPVHMTMGNHEFRAERCANIQPKQCGDLPIRLANVFARYRWNLRPFGEFFDLYGVDFVHCPLNIMGREMGGEHVERTVANKALRSLVMGHSHRRAMFNAPKVGQGRKISVLNVGTAMPLGMVERYTGLAMSGWTYGVYEIRIQAGVIIAEKFFDMQELSETYGD
jgi:hypothetical protein